MRYQRRKRATTCAEVRRTTTPPLSHSGFVGKHHSKFKELRGHSQRDEMTNSPVASSSSVFSLVARGQGHRSKRCPSCVSERLLCLGSQHHHGSQLLLTASSCRDGSLAVIQPLWIQPITENHPHVAVFILMLRTTHMTEILDGSVFIDQSSVQWVNMFLHRLKCRNFA